MVTCFCRQGLRGHVIQVASMHPVNRSGLACAWQLRAWHSPSKARGGAAERFFRVDFPPNLLEHLEDEGPGPKLSTPSQIATTTEEPRQLLTGDLGATWLARMPHLPSLRRAADSNEVRVFAV